ncbi:MAG: MFS transporter [Bryobacteraceae bacterium]
MSPFWNLLRSNRNYRYMWMGQVVSEVGDHFNTIAVLSLALNLTGSGMAVGGVLMARTLPAILAGPVAGVVLDRVDRRKIMIASDLVRFAIALCFILILTHHQRWMIYALSGLLMFSSPFFTSGRSAILPKITRNQHELHTANALTQTTAWLTLSVGAMLGGVSTMQLGYQWAFVVNGVSFLFSAWAIFKMRSPSGYFRAERKMVEHRGGAYAKDFFENLRYIRSTPLILALGLAGIGWASGGGAAQILFTLFGEVVFKGGPAAVGLIWGFAGVGLVAGGYLAHWLGPRLNFVRYKKAISICFFVHGGAYVLFSLAGTIWVAVFFITMSRVAMGANNVLNRTMLLTHVPDRFRGRVFSTVDMMTHTVMMLSLMVASIATQHYSIRSIGVVAGMFSASTAVFWAWANFAGKLTEPQPESKETEDDYEAPVTPA